MPALKGRLILCCSRSILLHQCLTTPLLCRSQSACVSSISPCMLITPSLSHADPPIMKPALSWCTAAECRTSPLRPGRPYSHRLMNPCAPHTRAHSSGHKVRARQGVARRVAAVGVALHVRGHEGLERAPVRVGVHVVRVHVVRVREGHQLARGRALQRVQLVHLVRRHHLVLVRHQHEQRRARDLGDLAPVVPLVGHQEVERLAGADDCAQRRHHARHHVLHAVERVLHDECGHPVLRARRQVQRHRAAQRAPVHHHAPCVHVGAAAQRLQPRQRVLHQPLLVGPPLAQPVAAVADRKHGAVEAVDHEAQVGQAERHVARVLLEEQHHRPRAHELRRPVGQVQEPGVQPDLVPGGEGHILGR
mmetsp:Transcript_3500/g.8727  ORF Transcript_3500/g.8727 Transcript_3500/m.8727 type:complete len:363 (+) Transcript_3500:1664-2752(+)